MHALLNVAIMAAHKGGDSLLRNLKKLDKLKVEVKGRNDFVSEADRQAERAVIETILKHYPEHEIIAEESGRQGSSEYQWVIDPLDGTTNFLHGFPVFCVSVACLHKGRPEHAVVYDPLRQELFTATRGDGAQLDGRRIRVSGETRLDRALIGTGFPYRESNKELGPYLEMLKGSIEETAGVRRAGAAALDLCYVAAGRLDAFWETGLAAWDIAAGALLIREAGGIISGLDGSEDYLETGHVLAGTPKIYASVARLFAPHIRDMFGEGAKKVD
ncbi:MAG: inositol monophosphatase [Gammaproteobacteria bacterium]|nr:inositol monophosphatase [Gammaproteobacteria bacterium]MDH5308590.1 inositol monophosphatase [Gammaproteobacteria bacterium]